MDVVNSPPALGYVKFLTGPMAGNTYPISKPLTSIGREPTNDIVVSDPSVSRQHAQIVYSSGEWSIRKLAPQNILTINQRNVHQSPLSTNDTIGLGSGSTFLFQVRSAVPQTPRGSQADVQPAAQQQQQQLVFPAQGSMAATPQAHTSFSPPVRNVGPTGTEQASFPGAVPASQPDGTQLVSVGVPTLEVSTNVDHERHTYQLSQPVIDIGRDPHNTIIINRPTVSSFHAQIVHEGNQLVLTHPHPNRERTLNGIDFMGTSVPGNQPFRRVLTRGDIFRISDENGTFVTLSYNDGSGATQEAVPEIHPIPLGAPVITIGRQPGNNVVLNHPQVSSQHARLEQVPGGYRLIDLGSTNHVYVNAQRIHTQQLLQPGDEIRIGPFKLTYTGIQLTQQDESNSIRVDALNLVKHGNKQVVLLDNISLAIPPRKFVALVGGSGAGKSTLMDALNGLRPAQQGIVLYNGQDYYKHLAAFSSQLGYVPQDDIIHRELTVEKALYYAAKLRLPDDFTKEQIRQRIDEVLADVDMKKQRNQLVNKLSGGQRKRVSIALELLANPSVFFLDEPTSGLDPGLDRKMMMLMRKLADRGRTIVLVTHATNNINACDYVCFLARGGRLAYFGPPNEAKTFFGKNDFAEIYSALEPTDDNADIPAQAEQHFKQSPEYQRYVQGSLAQGPAGRANPQMPTVEVKPPKRGNPWRQFSILAMRYLELLKNDSVNLAILLLQAPIIALILVLMTSGGTFGQNSIVTCPSAQNVFDTNPNAHIVSNNCQRIVDALKTPQGQAFLTAHNQTQQQAINQRIQVGSGGDAQKTLFFMAFAAVLFGCVNGAREIVKEAPIYKRERSVNLGIIPYMFSKFVVLGLLCMLQSLILVVCVFWRSPITTHLILPPFAEIYITMLLTSLAGLMIGLTISAVVPNNDRAMSLVPLALLPQVIFAGVIFSLKSTAIIQFLSIFFPTRWAMIAMGTSVGLHGDSLGVDSFAYVSTLFSDSSKSQAVAHMLLAWFALIIMIVVLGCVIGYFLKRKDVHVSSK
ncbi:MAG TPA: FHA domain-containing protein [Ktedonobacteraceae bacterium]|nr:FHA domain-containing protein [Ktedonobacteraceae bacterium]